MYENWRPQTDAMHDQTSAQTTAVSLRLRPNRIASAGSAVNQTTLLACLVDTGSLGSRFVTVTHALRQNESYTLDLSLDIQSTGRRAAETPEMLPELRALKAIAKIALPGFAPTSSGAPLLNGDHAELAAPGFDLFTALAAPGLPLVPGAVDPIRQGPVLPLHSPLVLDPDAAISALAACGRDVDLILRLSPFQLTAAKVRALVEAREKLKLDLFKSSDASLPNEQIRAALARLDRWLVVLGGMRVSTRLRFAGPADLTLVKITQSMLFGGITQQKPADPEALYLADCVPTGAPLPNIVPQFQTARTIIQNGLRRPLPVSGEDTLGIGTDAAGNKVVINADALHQHMYVIGATGVGKTTMLRSLILQDIEAGRGVFVIDPHGDLYADLCRALPAAARQRLVFADAGDFDAPFSINILQVSGPHAAIQRNFIVSQLIELFKSVYGHNPDAFGPMFESYFRAALMLLMDAGGSNATLKDMDRVFGDSRYRSDLLARCSDETVVSFWRNIALPAGGEAHLDNIAPYIVAKLVRLSGNPLIRPIVCTPHSTLDIPAALASGKVVLVNLAKGLVGAPDAAMLGGIITIRLFAAAMGRSRLPVAKRRLMRVYLDEFQTHAGPVLAEMMAEARKFGLSLVLANQSIAQIDGRGADIAHAILANSGNLVSFRLGPKDAAIIADWLGPEVTPRDLMDMANHNCIARLLQHGRPLAPQLVSTGR